jgi:hypothetical protein
MPGRRESADHPVATARRGAATIRRRAWAIGACVVWSLVGVAGCSGRGDGTTGGPSRRASGLVSPWADTIDTVGNQVPGIEAMPDYDAAAEQLRARVEALLPRPLPSPQAACTSMLDNARQYYVDVEGEGSSAAQTMAATRKADLDACMVETSPAAAACVAVLMRKSEGEYPWLLDQCSRAFPRAAG